MTESSKYLVMWHVCQEVNRRGLWNRIMGKKARRLRPIVHSYETQEIAEYGFRSIKSFGGKDPVLLKVLQE